MNFPTRTILALTVTLAISGGAWAQQTTTAAAAPADSNAPAATATGAETPQPTGPTASAAAETNRAAEQIREEFTGLLRQHPPQVATILTLDETLLANEPFLVRYPELARFLNDNPEVRRNPHYYLRHVQRPAEPRYRPSPFEEAFEAFGIAFVMSLIAFALAWFVRTVIEQRRWNRLSRTQAEVHNKILDRFGTTTELMEYIRSPAGTKFLESAPIPLHEERSSQNAPFSRVMRSIQVGVIIAVGALGLLLVSIGFDGEAAQGFFALGVIAFCIGAGFIASAVVSIVLSRRLGVWQEGAPENRVDESGLVR